MSKLITVFGATGNQGGSIVKHILADASLSKEFKIRGVTRDVNKPAATKLKDQGVEMVTADLNSKDSLRSAIKGSHTVFLVTNYWETMNADTEITQGKNVADVAKESGVQHLVFSSLLSVKEITNGRLSDVPYFDGKAAVEAYIRGIGVPATFFLPGYFMSNFKMSFQKGEDGSYTLGLPISKTGAKFPLFDVEEDTGKFVKGIVKNRESLLGKRIYGATDYYTAERILQDLEEVAGAKTQYYQVDANTYKSYLPEVMAQEMLENHLLLEEPGYYNGASLQESLRILDEKPVSWKEYVAKAGY